MWDLLENVITLLVSNNGSGLSVELVPSNSVGDRFFSKRGKPSDRKKVMLGGTNC